MDVVNQVEHFPQPGETIASKGNDFIPGGKGANQAVAVARAGGNCTMVGAVGDDPYADSLIASLQTKGVDTKLILRKDGVSGMAFITVNSEGENHIVLSKGANGKLAEADVAEAINDWSAVEIVLLQNEIPWVTTESVIRGASADGARVFFNPAPAIRIPDELFTNIDTLIVNETEAQVITGIPVSDPISAENAANWIIGKGAANVIVTLGEKGSLLLGRQCPVNHVPAFRVKAVDTTAAGDTFIGAYAAANAEGMEAARALIFAGAAAALAVTKAGAQSSIPSREEIESFLQNG
ncbi:ribokinase [Paenibacillus harenae]|uniref:Deoxyribokinase n=2 Tax=Paenibacillus harenae TaxID=306543 RepID=A0ABT9U6L8_PAEHA|nr:ribokinase [Paenibacillus harenae]